MQEQGQKFKKRDIIVIAVIVAAALLLWFLVRTVFSTDGDMVRVTIDGRLYGEYELSKEQEIPITIDGNETNRLVISEGYADMTHADCPDGLCVASPKISKAGQSIICLPNKVVVEIIGGAEAGKEQPDAVTR